MQVENLKKIGIEAGGEGARSGGLACAHFAGEQAGALMIDQELEPRLHLHPRLRGEQLLGVGAVTEGRFLKTEKGFDHARYSSSFFFWSSSTKLIPVGSGSAAWGGLAEGNWALTTGSTSRAVPCGWP